MGDNRFTFRNILAATVKEPAECWIWQGRAMSNGYPTIGRSLAHKRVYEELVGTIPEGFELDHLCKTPLCVNPKHLEPVPPRVNNMRSSSPASLASRQTSCIHGHPFDEVNTYVRKGRSGLPNRVCKTCRRDNMRKYVKSSISVT